MTEYRIVYTRKALKSIAKLDRGTVQRIRRFFEETLDRTNPRSLGTPLVNRDEWRYRVGDYRILCTIDDGELTVLVVTLAHRREVYR
ncbi:translation repressor RelE [Gordonia spumicola]|uniref:Translation repressor RelE n=1 Tax=Gordonia spumicola TaxID=589161 RepID=A0A7I9VD48_9ACTN|nr:type II toxin-antitoxin system RelE/ParE family toxin [Gordonia spumicola]GEE03286.1 translation repressor RelE [Gordonia spumicola]